MKLNIDKYVIPLLLLACINTALAYHPIEIPIWKDITGVKKSKSSLLSVYQPSEANNNGHAIIICPGGSYAYLGMKQEGHLIGKWMSKNGFTACVLRYRVAFLDGCNHPAMIEDLQRSIQIVRDSCQAWSIHTNKVGAIGFSAGGHLVGIAAFHSETNFLEAKGLTTEQHLQPDFAAMIYPVVSMTEHFSHNKSRKNLLGKNQHSAQSREWMSLERNIPNNLPPLLIMQAKDDKTVDCRNSILLSENMKQKQINHSFFLYSDGGHGFGYNAPSDSQFAQWKSDFLTWFNTLSK